MFSRLRSIAQTLKLQPIFENNAWKLATNCLLCNQKERSQWAICHACLSFLVPLGTACRICAMPLPDAQGICGACCRQKPAFDQVFTAHQFEEPLRTLLHLYKYKNGLYLTSLFASLMLQAPIDIHKITCLMPVPLHAKRLRERGFNQAAVLAKYLSKILRVPYLPNDCQKIMNTAPQARLLASSRQNNLKNAFRMKPIAYQHVTLVDDLLTTGNTANEVAVTLKNQGVQRVDIWCCARTVLRHRT